MTSPVLDLSASHAPWSRVERISLKYLMCFFLIPVLGYILPFFLEGVPSIADRLMTPDAGLLDYGYHLAGENADVVIFGDSAAAFGLDAGRLAHALHSKVINIPSTSPTLKNIGDWPLQKYFASNRPPRFLVLYFTPWDMNFAENGAQRPWQGDEQMVRHGNLHEIFQFARKHPKELILFPFRYYLVPNRLTHPLYQQEFRILDLTAGTAPYWITKPVPAKCILPAEDIERFGKGDSSVRELLHKYSGRGSDVFVYLAPIPGCSNADLIVQKDYSALHAAPPVVLAPQTFALDDAYIHPLANNRSLMTDQLAAALVAHESYDIRH